MYGICFPRRSTIVHPRSPILAKRAAKARKARGRKADLERGPMLAFGEEWSTEGGVGSPVGGPASLEIAAWAPGPQEEDEELSELLAAHNIAYDNPDACGTLLQIPKVGTQYNRGDYTKCFTVTCNTCMIVRLSEFRWLSCS